MSAIPLKLTEQSLSRLSLDRNLPLPLLLCGVVKFNLLAWYLLLLAGINAAAA